MSLICRICLPESYGFLRQDDQKHVVCRYLCSLLHLHLHSTNILQSIFGTQKPKQILHMKYYIAPSDPIHTLIVSKAGLLRVLNFLSISNETSPYVSL